MSQVPRHRFSRPVGLGMTSLQGNDKPLANVRGLRSQFVTLEFPLIIQYPFCLRAMRDAEHLF